MTADTLAIVVAEALRILAPESRRPARLLELANMLAFPPPPDCPACGLLREKMEWLGGEDRNHCPRCGRPLRAGRKNFEQEGQREQRFSRTEGSPPHPDNNLPASASL